MTTRGLIGFRLNGKLKGTYNHFDSYPSGLGAEVISFVQDNLLDNAKLDTFRVNASTLKTVKSQGKPSAEWVPYYLDTQGEPSLGMARALTEWYALLREFQGVKGLEGILAGKLKHWINSNVFLKDSLFCEFAYILDLDKKQIEFYKGFQKRKKPTKTGNEYGPCKKVGSIAFNQVDKQAMMELYGIEGD